MDLVTVTYYPEKDLMIRQAKSINKFVSGSINHIVVIQDDVISLEDWLKLLEPHYTHHKLKVVANDGDLKHHGGWVQTLQLKYSAARFVETDYYLILDSKNFFCKQTNLDEWIVKEGSGQPNPGSWTKTFVRFFANQINRPIPEVISNNITPYKVKTSTVKQLLKEVDFRKIIDDFGKIYPTESESGSIMYDFFSNQIVFLDSWLDLPFRAVWNGIPEITNEYLTSIDNTPHIKVFGVHIDHKQSKDSLKEFEKWCIRLGI